MGGPPGALRSPLAVAALIMTFWGATPVVTRLATEDLEPLFVGVWRTVLAGIVAVPIIAALRSVPPADVRGRILLAVSSATGFALFPLIYTLGQERTSAMHGGMILAALPIFTGTYGAILERRRPTGRWLAGCALALAGEFAIVALRAGSSGGRASLSGDLLVLVSALIVASGYVAGARLGQRGYPSLSTTLYGVALAALAMTPLAGYGVLADGVPDAGVVPYAAVAFLAVMTSIVGYIAWYWALAHGGIARIAPVQFLQPFSGLVLAAIVLSERFTLPLAVAAAAILAGIAIAQRTGGTR